MATESSTKARQSNRKYTYVPKKFVPGLSILAADRDGSSGILVRSSHSFSGRKCLAGRLPRSFFITLVGVDGPFSPANQSKRDQPITMG